jgi:hypothetical protein
VADRSGGEYSFGEMGNLFLTDKARSGDVHTASPPSCRYPSQGSMSARWMRVRFTHSRANTGTVCGLSTPRPGERWATTLISSCSQVRAKRQGETTIRG